MLHIYNLALIGKAVSEKTFEYYGNIHVQGWGQMSPYAPIFFRIINIQSYCSFPARPIQMHRRPMLTLPKICQGHQRVMIYVHIVVLESSMLNANSVSLKLVHQFWRKFLKGFYHIREQPPAWSCDLDFLYTLSFSLPIKASYKIWL